LISVRGSDLPGGAEVYKSLLLAWLPVLTESDQILTVAIQGSPSVLETQTYHDFQIKSRNDPS
jgi:hypothetical protein